MTIPRAILSQLERRPPRRVLDKPQRAGRGQDQAQGISAHYPLALAALIVPEAREDVTITNGDFDRPPSAILGENRLEAQREIRGEIRLNQR